MLEMLLTATVLFPAVALEKYALHRLAEFLGIQVAYVMVLPYIRSTAPATVGLVGEFL